jgi:hypothetical protein
MAILLVYGGYFITFDQIHDLGQRRGLNLKNGDPTPLNDQLTAKGITSISGCPGSYPRPTLTKDGGLGILICCRRRFDSLVHLADCKPFEENEDDLKVKWWLEINGIKNAPFVAVPDPFGEYSEYGMDMWD